MLIKDRYMLEQIENIKKLFRQDNCDEAIALAERLLKTTDDPEQSSRIWYHKSGVYNHQGNLPKALECLEYAIALQPYSPQSVFMKAYYLGRNHQYALSMSALEKLLALCNTEDVQYYDRAVKFAICLCKMKLGILKPIDLQEFEENMSMMWGDNIYTKPQLMQYALE